jgi:macrolide-specific efflux system membrane fusion protein
VQSGTTASATFGTAGTITQISVKVGDLVTKGQVLARVDAAPAQGQLDTATANLDAAQQSLNRAQAASADAATIASVTAQVTQARTAVDTAKRAVAGTVLTAPIAGTVIAVNGAVGSPSSGGTSNAGTGGSGATNGGATNGAANGGAANGGAAATGATTTGFVQLADLTTLQVNANFAEADATKLKAGQAATVAWSALSGARATGKIAIVSPTATTANNVNTYGVAVTLDSAPAGARIGQTTTVQVIVAQTGDVLRVPRAAVRTAGGQRTVQVRTDGSTAVRVVQIGLEGDLFTEITSGLNAGEQVVITIATGGQTGTAPGGGFPGGGFPGGGLPGGGQPGTGRGAGR